MGNSFDIGSIAISTLKLLLTLVTIVGTICLKILRFSGLWLTLLFGIFYSTITGNIESNVLLTVTNIIFLFFMVPVPIYIFVNNIFKLVTKNNSASLFEIFLLKIHEKKKNKENF